MHDRARTRADDDDDDAWRSETRLFQLRSRARTGDKNFRPLLKARACEQALYEVSRERGRKRKRRVTDFSEMPFAREVRGRIGKTGCTLGFLLFMV